MRLLFTSPPSHFHLSLSLPTLSPTSPHSLSLSPVELATMCLHSHRTQFAHIASSLAVSISTPNLLASRRHSPEPTTNSRPTTLDDVGIHNPRVMPQSTSAAARCARAGERARSHFEAQLNQFIHKRRSSPYTTPAPPSKPSHSAPFVVKKQNAQKKAKTGRHIDRDTQRG